jgi:hypothetical protein
MFTVEIRINGSLIGHVYGRNKGDNNDGTSSYEYEYYEPEQRKVKKGKVDHRRMDGAVPLVVKILSDAVK